MTGTEPTPRDKSLAGHTRRRAGLLATAEGTRAEAFAFVDWTMLAVIAGFWGSSFLLTAIALDHFAPGFLALLRLIFALAALAAFPAVRKPVERRDWPRLILLGVIWMSLPYLLFPLAQERIDSCSREC